MERKKEEIEVTQGLYFPSLFSYNMYHLVLSLPLCLVPFKPHLPLKLPFYPSLSIAFKTFFFLNFISLFLFIASLKISIEPHEIQIKMLTIYNSTTFLLLLFVFFTQHVSSFLQPVQPPNSPQVVLVEDKARLGSTPPSCHNRCNGCHPCMAVQAPTLPTRSRFTRVGFVRPPSSITTVLDQYSNYKPMGWKCHCNGHFYNP